MPELAKNKDNNVLKRSLNYIFRGITGTGTFKSKASALGTVFNRTTLQLLGLINASPA
ncbi:22115_t:CDS:2 [Rhizophagus irregularis]|nr:22115_t:CDS:2 [Rhizophagus irregularis]